MTTPSKIDTFIENIQQFLAKKRSSYVKLPRIIQLIITLSTFILGFIGVAIIAVLPEVGMPLIVIALGILSFEYAWAEHLLVRVVRLFGSRVFIRWITMIAFVVIAVVAIIWLNR